MGRLGARTGLEDAADFGGSSWPRPDRAWPRQEYTVKAYADFVEALVDTLHPGSLVPVGYLLGGAA